jgi:NAD(P) transhydrogenase subunit alpha
MDILIFNLFIFILACFIGFEVISKVPTTLHTPLMSGANAISGITLIGALVVAGAAGELVGTILGFVAIIFATI